MTENISDYTGDYMPFDPDALANWAEAELRCERLRAERAHAITPPLSPHRDYSPDSDYSTLSYPFPYDLQPSNKDFDLISNYRAFNDTLISCTSARAQPKRATRTKRQRSAAITSER